MSTDIDQTMPNPGWAAWRHHFDDALAGYVDALLWTSHCNGQARHPDPSDCRGEDCDTCLDDLSYDRDSLAPGAAREIEEDLQGFIASCLAERPDVFEGMEPGQLGHDFCLTRNRHGVGFWDRGLGERGDWLTEMSRPFGTQDAYVCSDDLVYVNG